MSATSLHFRPDDDQLVRLGIQAERYFPEGPKTPDPEP